MKGSRKLLQTLELLYGHIADEKHKISMVLNNKFLYFKQIISVLC